MVDSPKKLFVTGANGFIGRALMERYRAMGWSVSGVDLVAHGANGVVAGNVGAAGAWQMAARGAELVIHTAAVVSNTAKAEDYRAVTVNSVRYALDAAIAGGAKHFILISSVAALGLEFSGTADETLPVTTLSGYAYCDAKAASEHVALAAHAAGEMDVTIIRPGDVYGPGSRPWVLLPLQMMKARQFMLPAYGTGIFSPVYIDNLIDGIVLATQTQQAKGQIFHITDGAGVLCKNFFGYHARWLGQQDGPSLRSTSVTLALAKMMGFGLHALGRPSEMSRASVMLLARKGTYSIEKAQKLLGFEPHVPLAEGMKCTEHWLKQQNLI